MYSLVTGFIEILMCGESDAPWPVQYTEPATMVRECRFSIRRGLWEPPSHEKGISCGDSALCLSSQ